MTRTSAGNPRWYGPGDLNAFFGLMLDNLTNLMILAGILVGAFGFPGEIVFGKILPGTAAGVFFGDILMTWMAVRLARKTGREDVTAMPLGIDTVSLFGYTFGIIGPVYLATQDASLAWKAGMATLVITGLIKTALAFSSGWIKRFIPQAALLGSIAGIALLLIAFFPMLKILRSPWVGFVSFSVVMATLLCRGRLPGRLPGAFVAVVLGTTLHYALSGGGAQAWQGGLDELGLRWPFPTLEFLGGLGPALEYLPLIIPLSVANVIGGIDVTQSAEAAGDPYDTRSIIAVEGVTTLVGGLCGGVAQTTPYIGHPAYKAMGGRAGYTLLTAVFIGLGGVFGYISAFARVLPEAAVAPILVFIGLEITAQAFLSSPRHHAPAVAFSFLPTVAYLAVVQLGQFGVSLPALAGEGAASFRTLMSFSNGFIVTALVWGSAMACGLDQDWRRTGLFLWVGAVLTAFGFMHSPLPGGNLFFPWAAPEGALAVAGAYAAAGCMSLGYGRLAGKGGPPSSAAWLKEPVLEVVGAGKERV